MNLLVSILLSDILPIVAIASAGFLLARFAAVEVRSASRVVFYALLPCLSFRMLVTYDQSGSLIGRLMLLSALIMTTMAVVGYSVGKGLGLDSKYLRAFLMTVMFSNTGNYGLPVVRFAFGAQALADATVFFLTGSVITYLAASFFAGGHRRGFTGVIEKVWKMPSLYGVAAAIVVVALGWRVPDGLMRPIEMLSDAALPVMVLVLGMQLERAVWPARPGIVSMAVAISLLVTPLVALGLASFLGITGTARQAAVILSSMPVAVMTAILALEFEMAPEFATSAVFLSTVLSPLTLAPLIAYLQ